MSIFDGDQHLAFLLGHGSHRPGSRSSPTPPVGRRTFPRGSSARRDLVADLAFWNANRLSNADGAWPFAVETVAPGASLARQLMIFNATFIGTSVDLSWEMHSETADGPITDQGAATLEVPLGGHVTLPITVAAPSTGTRGYLVLVLQSSKSGQVIFREDAEWFQLQ